MQPGPPAPAATKPPRRRVRSESDRKKHAGWRRCPRCSRSVSTNGRNFYHHMHKCDRVFFADVIARIDATRAKLPHPPPPHPSPPPPPAAPVLSPTTPPRATVRTPLTENQRAIFMQQLCFLRVYDRTVDSVFRQIESTQTRVVGPSVFEAVRIAKRQLAQGAQPVPYTPPPYSPAVSSPPPRNHYAPLPLPEALASPLTPHQAPPKTADLLQVPGSGISRPAFARPMSHQSQQVMYQSPSLTYLQQQLPSMPGNMSAVNQAAQMPRSYPLANTQPHENPSVSTYKYATGSGVPSTTGHYPGSSHGPSVQVPPAPSNFSASTYAPASSHLPSSTSVPVSVQDPLSGTQPVSGKTSPMTNFHRTAQLPMSVSTPTAISASVSAIAPMSGHIPPSSNLNSGHVSAPISMPQSFSGQDNVVLSGNRSMYSGPGQNNLVPGQHEASELISEAQPVTSRPATPRQVSAMSISSVINT